MKVASPPPCQSTVKAHRNPHRRERPTPAVPTFPTEAIESMDVEPNPPPKPSNPPFHTHSDSLKVFLRLRPFPIAAPSDAIPKSLKSKHPKAKKQSKSCLTIKDSHSVTISPPCDSNRSKSEIYNGFTHVFSPDSSQDEVYEKLMSPIVEEFLNGKSGLLAAMGPSGSGKTHTVFGSPKNPGLVPRVLRRIFEPATGCQSELSRLFYFSTFEIYSERGKGEKLSDLSSEGADIFMQQSTVKGLKEVLIMDAAKAESLLAKAMSRRATATTNSNSQSSRSQCIINIRCAVDEINGGGESKANGAVLTFVDLAGAEREKKTGNEGGRLLESNFINKTSMVFNLCLRSLLQHQKNPKKPLQKHFQSSMLTRYLRDYLEGRKSMALILTVRSGEEDYFDTSFLLRQASPYMEIKFHNMEVTSNVPSNKRHNQTITTKQPKRVKLSDTEGCKDNICKTSGDSTELFKEDLRFSGEYQRYQTSQVNSDTLPKGNCIDAKLEREYHILRGFSKALWKVLKEYSDRVKTAEKEVDVLAEDLLNARSQILAMEKELDNQKAQCSCKFDDSVSRSAEHPNVEEHSGFIGCRSAALDQTELQGPRFANISEENVDIYPGSNLWSRLETKTTSHSRPLDTERGVVEVLDSEEESRLTDSEPMEIGLTVHQKPRLSEVAKAHHGDLPTCTKNSEFFLEDGDCDAILRKTSEGDTLPSLACEASDQSQGEQSFTECENPSDQLGRDDCHVEDMPKEGNQDLTVAVASLIQTEKDGAVQGEHSGCDTHGKEEKENVASGLGINSKSEQETKQTSHCKPLNQGRPRRRLMPASSLLLRDVNGIDIADESEKKVKGRQRLVEDDSNRSRGNASLLRLLKNHLPR